MKVSKKILKDLVARGDMPGIDKILRSLVREVGVKDEMLEEYSRDAAKVREAISNVERERERLIQACKEARVALKESGNETAYARVVGEYGEPDRPPQNPQKGDMGGTVSAEVKAALNKLDPI